MMFDCWYSEYRNLMPRNVNYCTTRRKRRRRHYGKRPTKGAFGKSKAQRKVKCTNWGCPMHACMSDECQLRHAVQNVPHIVAEFGPKFIKTCPNRKELLEAAKGQKA